MRPISAKTELIAKLIIIPIAATVAGHVVFYHQFPWQLNYSFPWFYVLRVAIIITVTWWINAKFYDRLDVILPFYRNPTQRILRQFTEGAIATLLVFTGLFGLITYFFADKSYLNLTAFTSGLVVCTILGTLLNAAFITAYLLETIGFEKQKTSEITHKLNKNAEIKNTLETQKSTTILIESGNSKWQLIPYEMAYFYSSGGIVFLMKTDGQKLTTNYRSFSEIENRLDDTLFFQLNRQFIVQLSAIRSVEDAINRKLIINLLPAFSKNQAFETVTVSRYRHAEFKKWFSMVNNKN
jgi:LytTr DNA-binding domain